MLSRDKIVRALAAVFETSRGQVSLADYRGRCAERLGHILGRRALIGTLNAYAESILANDSNGKSFALPFNGTTPLGDVLVIMPDDAVPELRAIATPGGIASSAVLGERVGAFVALELLEEEVDSAALVDLAYQTTLAMEFILERAESYRETEVVSRDARAKADLLATVSHEIRTPLNSIINLPEKLRENFTFDRDLQATKFVGDAAVALRSLEMLERSGQHLMNLVSDILDVSRLDAGQMPLHPELKDVAALLEQAVSDCSHLAEQREVTVTLESKSPLGEVFCDPLRFVQIVMNLVTNAVKYSSSGSQVILVASTRGDDHVEIAVTDEGIGISLKDQERIFERYIQLQPSDSEAEGRAGSGLGLHITRQLVELHDGTIAVRSELGRGSTFTVTLPRLARSLQLLQGRHEVPMSQQENEGSDHTILLIDDDATVLETAELLLEELGHALVSTTDVGRVDDLIEQYRPSLIVLDVSIAGVNGLDVLKRLRGTYDPETLPVLVSSGHPIEPRVLDKLGAGWLPKPWRRVDLLSAVSQHMRR